MKTFLGIAKSVWVNAGTAASIISLILMIFEPIKFLPTKESLSPSQFLAKEKANPSKVIPKKPSFTAPLKVEQKSSSPIPAAQGIAVLVIENDNAIDWTLSSTISQILEKRGVKITRPSVFNNSFLKGGGFAGLFNGDSRPAAREPLIKYFKTGFLGKKTVDYLENSDFTDIITSAMSIEFHVVSAQTGAIQKSITFSQKGAGFSSADASKNAEEKILIDIEAQLPSIVEHLGN
ncbi:MAG: hypothetical protein ACM3SY_05675 [Candidatus Omnitrophota bacterium]